MYIRTVTTKGVRYVQLAHNYRDPKTGVSKVRVLQSLGRADRLDVEGLKRLVDSICRFLEPYEGKALQPALGVDPPSSSSAPGNSASHGSSTRCGHGSGSARPWSPYLRSVTTRRRLRGWSSPWS